MMTISWRSRYWQLRLAAALAIVVGAVGTVGSSAIAQVRPDHTLGAESSRVTSPFPGTDQIDGGATRGTNLFHSFSQFSVRTGGVAYFNNAQSIQNIISRVTGGSVSNIDGLIRAKGTANLFLINPSGIIFGPNASLNIGGSFVGSTASSLNFADGTKFSATAHSTKPLLTVSVPIGLQFGGTEGTILNQSQATDSNGNSVGIQVYPGKTLALVGGSVSLDGGTLIAPGGRVELGGLTTAGTVGLNSDGSLSYPAAVQRGDVFLTGGAVVDVTAGGGGSIAVNARNLEISGLSFLAAGIGTGLGAVGSQAGDITLNATGSISIANSDIGSRVRTSSAGNGSNINIQTSSLSLTDGAQLIASVSGRGNAGNITIQAHGPVSFDGDSNGFPSGAFSIVNPGAVGKGGNVNITAGSLSLTNGAQVNASTFGQGDAGSVFVQARDSVSFANSLVSSSVESGAVGNGGSINIKSGSLSVTNGTQVQTLVREASDQLPAGHGLAGDVNINVSDAVTVAGVNNGLTSGFRSQVNQGAIGSGGNININAKSLSLSDGTELNANTYGQGNAGSVLVQARDSVSLVNSFIFSNVESGAVGNGGSVIILTSGSLSLTNGAQVSASTFGQGNAGRVAVTANGPVSFDGVDSNGFPSGAFSNVGAGAVGNGGNVELTAESLSLTNGAQVSVNTRGRGISGSVAIQARDNVSFDGALTGAFSNVDAGAVGNGGSVNLASGSLSLTNGAQVSAAVRGETGTGPGGP